MAVVNLLLVLMIWNGFHFAFLKNEAV